MNKTALFAFNGELMCFIHVLLNALDMDAKGHEVKVVIEGAATKLVPELADSSNPMAGLYEKVKSKGLFAGVCRACAQKMGTLESAKAEGLALLDDMNGHPSMAGFIADGYAIISF